MSLMTDEPDDSDDSDDSDDADDADDSGDVDNSDDSDNSHDSLTIAWLFSIQIKMITNLILSKITFV